MIQIRIAEKDDIEVIVNFQLEMALETENLVLDKDLVTKGVNSVFEDKTKGIYYVAEKNGDVVASLLTTYEWSDWRSKTILWVQSVYVMPEFRKNGIFGLMYSFIKNIVNESEEYCGIKLYVDKTNKKAQKVYESVGMNGEHYQLFEWMKN